MGEMTQGQKREQEYFRTAGHLRAFMARQAADSLTGNMRSTMVTGNHYGTRVIGKTVTRNALRNRGLIDSANMWTALGWAVVLLFVNEDSGWNSDYFRSPDDLHAEALQEDRERFPVSGNEGELTAEHADFGLLQTEAFNERVYQRALREGGLSAEPIPADLRRARQEIISDLHAEALAENDARDHERFLVEMREEIRRNGTTPRWEDGIPGRITHREQIVFEAAMAASRNSYRPGNRVTTKDIDRQVPSHHAHGLLVSDILRAVRALESRGLLVLAKEGQVYVITVPTLDDLHVMAIGLTPDPVQTTPAGSSWVSIDNRGSVRCRETGIIVQAIPGGRWEVLRPEWDPDRGGRVMRMAHIDLRRIEALGHAGRIRPLLRTRIALDWEAALNVQAARRTMARLNGEPEPLVSSDTVPGFRGGKIPLGWAPEHSAKLAAEARSDILTMPTGPGSLVAAAEIVDRVVKRARYDALKTAAAEIAAWNRDHVHVSGHSDPRHALNRAARKLGTPEVWEP